MKLPMCHLGWSSLVLIGLTGCPPTQPSTPTPAPAPGESKPSTSEKPAPGAEKPEGAMPTDPTKPSDPGKPENSPSAKANSAKLTDEEVAEIKKLPAEDQALALAQMTCPVSNNHLGGDGMGMPIKKVVDGKTFFLCCSGCEGEVEKDPKGVIAKLEKK